MQVRRRLSGIIFAAVLGLSLAACQDDGGGLGSSAQEPATTTTPQSTAKDPTTKSTPRSSTPTAKPIPKAPGAAGPKLVTDEVSIRVPRGWGTDSEGDDTYLSASDRDTSSNVQLYSFTVPEDEPVPSLLGMVDGGLRYARDNVSTTARQAANVLIQGKPVVHIVARYDDTDNWFDEYDGVRGRSAVSLQIEVDGTQAERRRIVNSILATWRWRSA